MVGVGVNESVLDRFQLMILLKKEYNNIVDEPGKIVTEGRQAHK